jgi:uncharacterized protein (DUF2132 family)
MSCIVYIDELTMGKTYLLLCYMNTEQPNNPLHGKTLEAILQHLVDHYGWEEMNERVRINCFFENPSISSSLKFLRKTPWARKKVEDLYLESLGR